MIDVFMSAKEQEIAEHLTLLDFSIYAAIEVTQLSDVNLVDF